MELQRITTYLLNKQRNTDTEIKYQPHAETLTPLDARDPGYQGQSTEIQF